jgi:YebC/PmpR family DNA-binding regulatory protein
MSGHSKWHSIKHKKGAADTKRGKIFTHHAKLIEIAAREGGGADPDKNPRLRTAIENAKTENVPNANIERAIKKGTGQLKDATQTIAVTYEAYGPGGSAYLIECLTDNQNRTLPNVKTILGRNGGKFAEKGSVAFLFEQKGVVIANINKNDADEIQLSTMDAGAEDIEVEGSMMDITTGRGEWPAVRNLLRERGCDVHTAGLKFIPLQTVEIGDKQTAEKILILMDALEDDEDVAEVHTNASISTETAFLLQSKR